MNLEIIPLLPGAPTPTPVAPIRPPPLEPIAGTVGGWEIVLTIFILGLPLIAMVTLYIFMRVFASPMDVAKSAGQLGGSIIQHFNTPKSAEMKVARVEGDAFRYQQVRDGTVAAIPESVLNVSGRQTVLTYGNLGITIPPKILGAISVLVYDGINSIKELRKKYTVTKGLEKSGKIVQTWEEIDNRVVVSGYDFTDFKKLSEQTKTERLIPLSLEAVPRFVEQNINADITEKILTIPKIKFMNMYQDDTLPQFIAVAMMVVIVFIVSTVVL